MKQQIKQIINQVNFTEWKNKAYFKAYYNSLSYQKDFKSVKNYCIFIGYQRSGSSLVGALLDAHPDAVIAHELNVMQYFEANYSKDQIFYLLLDNARKYAENGRKWSGYNYQVPNQWQGRFQEIKIIGDKKAALSAIKLSKNPQLLEQIKKTVNLPLKIIHIVRNPYDNITTMFKKKDRKQTAELDFQETINYYFSLCDNINSIKKSTTHSSVFDLRQESLIQQPQNTLKQLCNFLDLESTEAYLEDCASIIFNSPKKTRHSIDWKESDIELVATKIEQYDFLKGYSMNS